MNLSEVVVLGSDLQSSHTYEAGSTSATGKTCISMMHKDMRLVVIPMGRPGPEPNHKIRRNMNVLYDLTLTWLNKTQVKSNIPQPLSPSAPCASAAPDSVAAGERGESKVAKHAVRTCSTALCRCAFCSPNLATLWL